MLEDFKEKIRKEFLRSDGRINTAKIRPDRCYKNKIWGEVIEHTSFLPENVNPSERIYCILNDIRETPVCPVCGKKRSFSKQYHRYSNSCGSSSCFCKLRIKVDMPKLRRDSWKRTIETFKHVIENGFEVVSVDRCVEFIKNLVEKTDRGRKHCFVDQKVYSDYPFVLASIIKYTGFILVDESDYKWNERFYCLLHSIYSVPVCKICGKPVEFKNFVSGYREYCCTQCSSKDAERIDDLHSEYFKKAVSEVEKQGFSIISEKHILNDGPFVLNCEKCGKVFEKLLNNGDWTDIRCPGCFGDSGVSRGEKEMLNYIKTVYDGEIRENVKIDGFEIDIYIPELKLGIEFDGIYWHSELVNSRKYNLHEKTEYFKNRDIRILHFYDYEWVYKKDIVKSMLVVAVKAVGKTHKIGARKCIVKTVDKNEKNKFLNENHIQGPDKSSVAYGLYYNDELVSIMTFGKRNLGSKEKFELLRFCSKIGYVVNGAANKLITYFENNYRDCDELVSYANKRFSVGNVYFKMGFEYKGDSTPCYYYFKGARVYHRMAFQKHRLSRVLKKYDSDLSEWENMRNNGYNRIFDCGNMVFKKVYNRD